ncbi:MAG: hypothetical protein Q4C61_12340 [Lachnospiraceae bacterium]|nr:hypothetical protein [Lachnospiraceae bacterium]
MFTDELGNLFGQSAGSFNNIRNVFLFNAKAFVTDINLTDESNHFIEDPAAFIN